VAAFPADLVASDEVGEGLFGAASANKSFASIVEGRSIMGRQQQWVIVGDILVSYGGITDDNWDEFIKDLKTPAVMKYLGVTLGAVEVSSVHRKEIFETTKSRGTKVGVVTDERVVRGIVTAASWMGVNVKAFSWEDLRKAAQYLGAEDMQEQQVVDAVNRLRSVGTVQQKKVARG
jgi:hypothetical protein